MLASGLPGTIAGTPAAILEQALAIEERYVAIIQLFIGDPACRASVLASEGKAFCAGADFNRESESDEFLSGGPRRLYEQAVRLFACEKPMVAAIQGAAVGGGLGLALAADSGGLTRRTIRREFCEAWNSSGIRIDVYAAALDWDSESQLDAAYGPPNHGSGGGVDRLADVLAPAEGLREEARKLAAEIGEGAPLAVRSTRATLRRGLTEAVRAQTTDELAEQTRLARTEDHKEGIRAVTERRAGHFRER